MAQKEEEVDVKQKSNNNTKINEILSDEGKIALVKLCWLELCSLYGENHERPFVKKYICDFMKYLDFPKEVQTNLAESLLSGIDNDVQTDIKSADYTDMLVKNLKKDCDNKDENHACISQSLIIFTLETGKYDARHRVVLSSVSNKLGMSQAAVEDIEHELVSHLKTKDEEKSEEEKQREEQESSRKLQRGFLIGLGALGGGALIGLTGGLAAPFLAAGAGSLFGSGIAVALGSIKGVAIVASLFSAAGAGLTGLKLNRRMGSIEEFAFGRMDREDSLNVVIAVSGWLEDQEQQIFKQCGFEAPWKDMKLGREQYYLRWESSYLQELGTAISSFLTSSALEYATDQVVEHTILEGIASAVAWPLALLEFGYVIDNPWGVCVSRSAEVGNHLAYILMERNHGNRPVTLVGFSFGARVIFKCLKAMTEMKDSDWIIQDVILIGAPVSGDPEEWKGLEKVIAGKIVNCYCRGDWLLKFVYRAASVQGEVAGLKPVMWKNRRMFNVNLDMIVKRHTDYCDSDKIKEILEEVSKGGVCPLDVDVSSSEDSGISLTSGDLLDLNETLKETAAAAVSSVEKPEASASVPEEKDKVQAHSEAVKLATENSDLEEVLLANGQQRQDCTRMLNTDKSDESTLVLEDTSNADTPALEETLLQQKTNQEISHESIPLLQGTSNADGPALEDTSELCQAKTNQEISHESTPVLQDTSSADGQVLEDTSELCQAKTNQEISHESTPVLQDTSSADGQVLEDTSELCQAKTNQEISHESTPVLQDTSSADGQVLEDTSELCQAKTNQEISHESTPVLQDTSSADGQVLEDTSELCQAKTNQEISHESTPVLQDTSSADGQVLEDTSELCQAQTNQEIPHESTPVLQDTRNADGPDLEYTPELCQTRTNQEIPHESNPLLQDTSHVHGPAMDNTSDLCQTKTNLDVSHESTAVIQCTSNANGPVLDDTPELCQAKTNLDVSHESTAVLQCTSNADGQVLEDTSELYQAKTNLEIPNESTQVLQDTCNADGPDLKDTPELCQAKTNLVIPLESTPVLQNTSSTDGPVLEGTPELCPAK